MMTHLLDGYVLIALTVAEHEYHEQVTDAHLVSPTAGRADSVLATLDEGLVRSALQRAVLVPLLR
jgi:hypothetical protein